MNLLINTSRLCIRNLLVSDIDDFYAYRSDAEVTKYQGFDVMTKQQCEKFIESQLDKEFGKAGEWVQYAIALAGTNKLIGDCAVKLQQYDTLIAEIGITISPNYQRKGYAQETLKELLTFLFDKQAVHRVVETVDAENVASIHLLKSVGFREEGHFVENIFFKGKWGSEYQYAMLKREWDNLKK